MALLTVLFFLAFPWSVHADTSTVILEEVIFDWGDPDQSVGIVEGHLLEAGDLYKQYRVLTFEPEAIVMENPASGEKIKWVKEGEAKPEDISRALDRFMVAQMRAIYEAQLLYFHKWQDYAPDLERLISHGVLVDGFREGKKQNYFFEIAEVKSEFGKEPSFMAVASPAKISGEGPVPYYFSVDELGLVRFADTRSQVSWGPVWEYADHSGGPPSQAIWENEESEGPLL